MDRIPAALAYVGLFSLIILACRPSSTFVRRHVQVAAWLLAARILWAGLIVSVWWGLAETPSAEQWLASWARDLASLLVAGVPWHSTWRTGALPWLLSPVLLMGLLSVAGAVLAALGRSADLRAFTSTDWSDPVRRRMYLGISPVEEKTIARRARERQIERIQSSSRLLRDEQARRSEITEVEEQLERLAMQREYNDQLLALGEISQRRYERADADLDERVAGLRGQLSGLETRVRTADGAASGPPPSSRLSRPSETLVESIAIVTPGGLPIFTYGQFQLDDAIVAGMLSAFDSLSHEVFGSRVHKTELAAGQVLYFAHGDYVLIMASFIEEPSPRQIEDLRTMLKQFEGANVGPVSRGQYDPSHLHQVPIPFRFSARSERAGSVLHQDG